MWYIDVDAIGDINQYLPKLNLDVKRKEKIDENYKS